MSRPLLTRAHAAAGSLACVLILSFWTSTAAVELFGSDPAIARVKLVIACCLPVLVAALATTGLTGRRLCGQTPRGLAARKLTRLKIAAANGVLVLIPAALFLAVRAAHGQFGTGFAIVQAIELVAGPVNLVLLGLNMRDGMRMSGRFRKAASA